MYESGKRFALLHHRTHLAFGIARSVELAAIMARSLLSSRSMAVPIEFALEDYCRSGCGCHLRDVYEPGPRTCQARGCRGRVLASAQRGDTILRGARISPHDILGLHWPSMGDPPCCRVPLGTQESFSQTCRLRIAYRRCSWPAARVIPLRLPSEWERTWTTWTTRDLEAGRTGRWLDVPAAPRVDGVFYPDRPSIDTERKAVGAPARSC